MRAKSMNSLANVAGLVAFIIVVTFVALWGAAKGAVKDARELWNALVV